MFSVKSISHVDFPFYCVYSYFLIFVQLWLSFKHETTAPKVSCRQRSHPIFFFFFEINADLLQQLLRSSASTVKVRSASRSCGIVGAAAASKACRGTMLRWFWHKVCATSSAASGAGVNFRHFKQNRPNRFVFPCRVFLSFDQLDG